MSGARTRTARAGTAALLAVLLGTGLGVAGGAPASADPIPVPVPETAFELDDVTARAELLSAEVDLLGLAVAQAAEEHAAASERLRVLVSEEISADQRLSVARQQHSVDNGTAARRAQALYRTGGASAMLQNVLTSDPAHLGARSGLADLATDLRTVRTLVGADADRATASGTEVADATQAAAAVRALRVERQEVEAVVEAAAAAAQEALGRHQQLLGEADAEVVRVADRLRAEQEAAALAAAEAAAAAAAESADGTAAAPSAAAAEAITAAQSMLGRPYRWGATGPESFDCSGLTSWAYRQAGVSIPRTSRTQYAGLPKVALAELAPGDLVFYGTSADPGSIHHVALYLGGGRVLHAPQTGDVVKVAGLVRGSGSSVLVGAVRPTGAAA